MSKETELIKIIDDIFCILDKGKRYETGPGGQTIESQLRRTMITQVPAFGIEEARERYLEIKDYLVFTGNYDAP